MCGKGGETVWGCLTLGSSLSEINANGLADKAGSVGSKSKSKLHSEYYFILIWVNTNWNVYCHDLWIDRTYSKCKCSQGKNIKIYFIILLYFIIKKKIKKQFKVNNQLTKEYASIKAPEQQDFLQICLFNVLRILCCIHSGEALTSVHVNSVLNNFFVFYPIRTKLSEIIESYSVAKNKLYSITIRLEFCVYRLKGT